MKKAISIILAVLVVFAIVVLLTSCGHADTDALDGHGKRFMEIHKGYDFRVVVDTETGVEYVVSDSMYNRGTFTMLYDSYGNPYIYPAFDAREDAP